jgi:hypothetical protein
MFEVATNAASTPIVPQDRFIAECLKLEEAPPYAAPGEQPKAGARPGIRWILALYSPTDGRRFHFQDEPYEFFQTTTSNMQRGARAREYAEAFLGREIAEGEMLSPDTLVGKRCIGMVIHELTRDKTKKNAKLVAVEPYRAAGQAATAPVVTQVSAEPSDADVERALLATNVERLIKKSAKQKTDKHLDWQAYNPSAMTAEDLETLRTHILLDIENSD